MLVHTADGKSYEFVEVTAEQAYAYANGGQNWQTADTSPSSPLSRAWRRLIRP